MFADYPHFSLGLYFKMSFQNFWQIKIYSFSIFALTCITLIGSPVSFANCSRICRVGFGVCEKADFSISSCFALMVVLGPLRLEPPLPSSGDLFSAWESLVSVSPSNEPWVEKRNIRMRGRVGGMVEVLWTESQCFIDLLDCGIDI